MSTNVQSVSSIKSGTCPHGMAPGACPICSGMGGGGSSRVGERPQKAGEMSYHQCAMIGAMMRAREQRIENHEKIYSNTLKISLNSSKIWKAWRKKCSLSQTGYQTPLF